MSKWIRASMAAGAVVAVMGGTGCEPSEVSSSSGPRGSVIEVGSEACEGWMATVEARLVVIVDGAPTVAARAQGDKVANLIVPDWAPLGPATVTLACLEPLMSHDTGPSWTQTDRYANHSFEVTPGGAGPSGTLTIGDGPIIEGVATAGTGCNGHSVEVAASPLGGVLERSDLFLYGARFASPAGDGTWQREASLVYSSDMIWDAPRPGPIAISAACNTPEGSWNYPPTVVEVGDPTPLPEVHLGTAGDTAQVGQCLLNELTVTRTATMPGGEQIIESQAEMGTFTPATFDFSPTPGAEMVLVEASCQGPFGADFDYVSATWSAS